MLTGAVVDTQKLNYQNAEELKKCKSVNIFSESTGWSFAYGFDSNDNLSIAVHAHSEDELRNALITDEQKEKQHKSLMKKINDPKLTFEERRELNKKLLYNDY